MYVFFTLLSATITFIFFIFFYVWYLLHKSMRIVSDLSHQTPKRYQLDYQTRSFVTKDEITLSGWYIPAKKPKAVVITIPGYGDTRATHLAHTEYLNKAGYSTFFINVRSAHPDIPVTLGVKEWQDVEAAYDYMKSLPENHKLPIGFFSGSMGAAASIIAAGKTGKGDFLIAGIPYANFTRLFTEQLKVKKLPKILLPFTKIAAAFEFGFDYEYFTPEAFITNIHAPILIMLAQKDDMVSKEDAQYLYDLANKPKVLWKADTTHAIFKEEPEEFQKQVINFLDTYAVKEV